MIWFTVFVVCVIVLLIASVVYGLIESYKREAKEDEAWISILGLDKDEKK
jgi:hypothetical protein